MIPLKEQTPQEGQNKRAQVRNIACYTWKSSIHCRDRPSFLFTHTKKAVSDTACGVKPYKFRGAQKAGQTPQSGQVICVYTEGQKAGLTPHVGFDPAIGALCKRSKYGTTWHKLSWPVVGVCATKWHAFAWHLCLMGSTQPRCGQVSGAGHLIYSIYQTLITPWLVTTRIGLNYILVTLLITFKSGS